MPRSVAGAEPSNQHAQPGETGHVAPEVTDEGAAADELTVTDQEDAQPVKGTRKAAK